MPLRRLFSAFAVALLLSGCAHSGDWATEISHRNDGPDGWSTAISHDRDGAVAAFHAVSEPTVVPVSFGGPQAVADTDGPYLLDSGDRLRVFVYGQPNLSRLYMVDHGGAISMPLAGRVRARGLTTYQLEARIRSLLGAKFIKDPEVTVDVAQNRPFFILGEVRTAGQYPYVNGMTVRAAVAIAGGYSERADKHKIQITRRINGLVETLDVPDDYVVTPGDTLLVYERFF
ncbi:MAG: polysaccharide biosynthesis/export family protein [Hyphomicrobiaceae bacterium]